MAIVGRTSAVRERYYAISAERRLKHAGVAAITSAARTEVFGDRDLKAARESRPPAAARTARATARG